MSGEIERFEEWPDGGLWPMADARKDRTPILARLRPDLQTVRAELERLNGLWVVVRTTGGKDWGLAGPFGYGGLPDEWFEGFVPLPGDDSYFK